MENEKFKCWSKKTQKSFTFIVHTLWSHGYQQSGYGWKSFIIYPVLPIELFSIVFSKLNCLHFALHCRTIAKLTKIDGNSNGSLNEIALEFNLFNAGMKWCITYRYSVYNNWILNKSGFALLCLICKGYFGSIISVFSSIEHWIERHMHLLSISHFIHCNSQCILYLTICLPEVPEDPQTGSIRIYLQTENIVHNS